MAKKRRLKLLLIMIVSFMVALVGYKAFILLHESDYEALNAKFIDEIKLKLRGREAFSFAVVGNIRNSMWIFERRIGPMMNRRGVDFMVSAGNAVYDGAEGKYRLLYRGLKTVQLPYILTVGPNEIEDFGADRFYRHFGPFFFSFHVDDSLFIFIDSTGHTSWEWQLPWLRAQLTAAQKYRYRFVFMSDALTNPPRAGLDGSYMALNKNLRRRLRSLFSEYRVSAVFSAGYPTYSETVSGGVRYIVSGGGGGLLLDKKQPYQFVKVTVGPDGVRYQNVTDANRLGTLRAKLETLKLYLHSVIYMSLFSFLLILSTLSLLGLRLYWLILRQEHLYRDFSTDQDASSIGRLRIAMFTNAYLPFVGGVSLSVDRLYRALEQLGEKVKVFAPTYPQPWADPDNGSVYRCPTPLHTHLDNSPVVNVLARDIASTFKEFDCDLVHVHHPYWLGKKGMRLARKSGLPVVFTYHTRLDRYTDYLPVPGKALKALAAHSLIKRFANHCDAIITPTASTEEYLRNLGVSALVETIPTGVDSRDYDRWSRQEVQELRSRYVGPEERLLISASRMAKEKNVDFLIAGLVKLRERSEVPFKCILAGDGPERERLEASVAELGISEHVVFTGSLDPHEIARYYLASDLFVFASTSETQGMVLLEAMAGGCPVVAVRSSGVYDVVRDGHNGFKVAESTDSWADAVARVLTDGSLLATLSENSRSFAASYSETVIAEKVQHLYRRVVVLSRSRLA